MSDSPFAHDGNKRTYEAYEEYRKTLPPRERMTTLFIDIAPSDEYTDEMNDYLEKTAYNLRRLKDAHDSLVTSFNALLEADDKYIKAYVKGRTVTSVILQDKKFRHWTTKMIVVHENMHASLAQIELSMKATLAAARRIMNADDSPF